MLESFKKALEQYKEKRAERKARPWSKKQKIIFLSFIGALILYIIISTIIAYGETGNNIEIPSLQFDISGFDIAALVLVFIALAVVKIIKYFKSKGE